MADRIFQIRGATIPRMVGRTVLLQRLISSLTKPTPDHLQVVGPRFGGKSVLLQALAEQLRRNGSYQSIAVWDLGHQTPDSNESFMRVLRDKAVDALAATHSGYADYIRSANGNPYKELAEVFDELKQQSIKVLMLWDGFDKPLAGGKLTRTLWDQLRELASRPSLRLVTASRRRLTALTVCIELAAMLERELPKIN